MCLSNEEKILLEKVDYEKIRLWMEGLILKRFEEFAKKRFNQIDKKKDYRNDYEFLSVMEKEKYTPKDTERILLGNILKLSANLYVGGSQFLVTGGFTNKSFLFGKKIVKSGQNSIADFFYGLGEYKKMKGLLPLFARKNIKGKTKDGMDKNDERFTVLAFAECLRNPNMIAYWIMILHLLINNKLKTDNVEKLYPPVAKGSETVLSEMRKYTINVLLKKNMKKPSKEVCNAIKQCHNCIKYFIQSSIEVKEKKIAKHNSHGTFCRCDFCTNKWKYLLYDDFERHNPEMNKNEEFNARIKGIIDRKVLRHLGVYEL